jgi:hypothetical protein
MNNYSAQQGKCTRTAKSAARSSLCFLLPVICGVPGGCAAWNRGAELRSLPLISFIKTK